jgi:hypothetical protein
MAAHLTGGGRWTQPKPSVSFLALATVSSHADELRQGTVVVEMGNVALPVLGLLRGEDEGIEGLKAERLT